MAHEEIHRSLTFLGPIALGIVLALSIITFDAARAAAQTKPSCKEMRKVKLGVSVSPPNVVHTPPFVARALGFFANRCIEAEIVEFEGGLSAANLAAVAQGQALATMNATAIAQGLKAKQIWGMAPRLPQAYVVGEEIKMAADLKGKRLSATGGGVGGFNWVMGREVLKTAGLTVNDVQFVSQATAGRLPGLVSGQIHGVALHPEDVYLAQKQKPGVRVLVDLSQLLPKYFFNAYGAADGMIAKDRALVRDVVTSLIEANRAIYTQREKVIPVMVEATKKPPDAVNFAYDYLTKNCVWSVNAGFSRERTEWSIDNAIENGDIQPDRKPTYDQVVDVKLGEEALAAAGGPTKIRNCGD
ncbi:MAG TPA: ABC transporter substrate-binding protein [Candidatus Binatia bacterium]|jgi:ABC-type nitrate/sulfonate/bicarbonate transport system substrate-binding protein|nr:ABC transporter substrate-binding protein [Candidatus Binatia bacterium]